MKSTIIACAVSAVAASILTHIFSKKLGAISGINKLRKDQLEYTRDEYTSKQDDAVGASAHATLDEWYVDECKSINCMYDEILHNM